MSFVENYKPAINVLKKNIQKFRIRDKCEIYECDFLNFKVKKNYDFIFLDPPFSFKEIMSSIMLIFLSVYS